MMGSHDSLQTYSLNEAFVASTILGIDITGGHPRWANIMSPLPGDMEDSLLSW